MAAFHVRNLLGVSWPGLPAPEVSQLWAMFLELERTQWLDPAAIEEGQLKQVRSLLRHSIQHVPHYQETLSAAGIRPDDVHSMEAFRRIPLLQRRTYQEQFPRFQARSLPSGTKKTIT